MCFSLYPPQGHYNDECKFKEKLLANHYNAYESAAYPGMYIWHQQDWQNQERQPCHHQHDYDTLPSQDMNRKINTQYR